jgi:hypothetical protein
MARVLVDADRSGQPGRRRSDLVVACYEGHVQAWKLRGIERWVHPRGLWTYGRPKHCRYCEAPVIAACEACSKGIAATRTHSESDDWKLDSYCAWCGTTYPWTMLEEASAEPPEQGSDRERDRAVERVKRAGRSAGKFLLPHLDEIIKTIIRHKLGPPSA